MKTRIVTPSRLLLASLLLATGHSAYAAATAAGTQISNTATASYIDSTSTQRTATSNTVITTVQQVASMTMTAGTTKNGAPNSQVVYAHSLTNTGNGADIYSLSSANSGNFSMANVTFYADANGDGVADSATPITSTGSVAAGTTFKFVAVATLPSGATVGNTNALVVTATSDFNGSVTANSTDTTTVTAGAALDITANSAGSTAPGNGPGVEANAVVTNYVAAGGTTRFTLYLNNSGGSADTFNLSSSTDSSFGTLVLPSGWSVVFKDAGGSVITSATVAANGNKVVYADVTVAEGSPPATTDVYFRALSGSGVGDRIHEAVTVALAGGQINLAKTQAIDANCDGTADTTFSAAAITTGAVPGACIRYEITATNTGVSNVTALVIKDNVPANTTYHSGGAGLLAPLAGALGVVQGSYVNVAPGEAVKLSFGVKINP